MQLPSQVAVMTLSNAILFPQAMLPLHIFETRYRKMLADALDGSRMFAVAMQKPGSTRECPFGVAGLGMVRASVTNSNGTSNLILQGLVRVELLKTVKYKPYRVNHIRPIPPSPAPSMKVEVETARLLELVGERLRLGFGGQVTNLVEKAGQEQPDAEAEAITAFRKVVRQLSQLDDPEQLTDLVSATLLPDPRQRQVILETISLEERMRHLIQFLNGEIQGQKPEK
jgi:Lon protease-like protein